jgi:uncharacterized membrane protein
VTALRVRLHALGLGAHPLCKPRGSGPRIGGFALPFCWRCSGVLAGAVAAHVAWRLSGGDAPASQLALASTLLALPAVGDVVVQSATSYTSAATTRFATGTLLGVAVSTTSRFLAIALALADRTSP